MAWTVMRRWRKVHNNIVLPHASGAHTDFFPLPDGSVRRDDAVTETLRLRKLLLDGVKNYTANGTVHAYVYTGTFKVKP